MTTSATTRKKTLSPNKAWRELYGCKRLSFDLENTPEEVSCIAFSGDPSKSYVFPTRKGQLDPRAIQLLESEVPKCAQNGAYDLYVLRKLCGVEVNNYADDTIVAWHSCYPELAGASQNKKGAKRTRKSLEFLASMYTTDAHWKDYSFETSEDQFLLCGRDACITFSIMAELDGLIERLGVRRIYEHQLRLIWPCIRMQQRGILIDNAIRETRIKEIAGKISLLEDEIIPTVETLFADNREKVQRQNLFWQTKRCPCCNNGKIKTQECWSCAGFDKKPTKKMLVEAITPEVRYLAEADPLWMVEGVELKPCTECKGRGSEEVFGFNPNSSAQKIELLYNVLKLPKRLKDGKPTVDEEALKGLLAKCQ